MKAVVQLDNVYKSFDDHEVLKEFSLQINEGSMIAIQGKSGSGKSTLLNLIGCIEGPTKGDIVIFGDKNPKPNSSKAMKILRNKITYLFQNYALVDNKTVIQNLKIAQKYADKDALSIADALRTVGLEGFENRKIYTLSGGEQQRISLARALIKPGTLILADEPTGNVDDENAKIIMDLFLELKKRGKTIVIVTHDRSLNNYFDQIVII